MTPGQLMWRHAEAWVRLIALEREWGMPREQVLALAGQQVGDDPQLLNVTLKAWQKTGRPGASYN